MKIVEIVYAKLQVWSMFVLDGAAYFLIAMVGAFVKDIYDTYSGVKTRIEIFHIVVSASLSTFLIFAARNYTGEDLLPAINFILGIVGWELFVRVSTIDGLINTVKEVRSLILTLIGGTSSNKK